MQEEVDVLAAVREVGGGEAVFSPGVVCEAGVRCRHQVSSNASNRAVEGPRVLAETRDCGLLIHPLRCLKNLKTDIQRGRSST